MEVIFFLGVRLSQEMLLELECMDLALRERCLGEGGLSVTRYRGDRYVGKDVPLGSDFSTMELLQLHVTSLLCKYFCSPPLGEEAMHILPLCIEINQKTSGIHGIF